MPDWFYSFLLYPLYLPVLCEDPSFLSTQIEREGMHGVFRGETRVSPLPFLFHPLNDNDNDDDDDYDPRMDLT